MTDQKQDMQPCEASNQKFLLNRRQFLFGVGASLVMLHIPGWLQRGGMPATVRAQVADYPRQVIGQLSQLKANEPVEFRYPWDHDQSRNFLIQLAEPAGGGVGPDQNVVAFNNFCTHQGMPLEAPSFKGEIGVAGPCPLHWTTFDLTRHGMVHWRPCHLGPAPNHSGNGR